MLVGIDVGGTKVHVAWIDADRNYTVRGDSLRRYDSAAFAGLTALIRAWQQETGLNGPMQNVGVSVAGPVRGRSVRLTNLPWSIDADVTARETGARVVLINDLAATANAVALQGASDLTVIKPGQPDGGNRAVIAAGTGLGQALLVAAGDGYAAVPTEGGHADFAPGNADELRLLHFLQKRYDHVSWERVVSGLDGMRNLYDFLLHEGTINPPAQWRRRFEGVRDCGPLLSDAAAAGESFPRAIWRWFAGMYGAEAGNLALKSLATGGVYLAGGIAARLGPHFDRDAFVARFTAKGRFSGLMQEIPVYLMNDQLAPLRGAAAFASAAQRRQA